MSNSITRILKQCKASVGSLLFSADDHEKVARSFCIGLYIAFSPFPGLHGIMMLASQALFRLNFPVLFFATSLNNPWTMIPFYALDYSAGYWIVHNAFALEPSWTLSLAKLFGSGKICIWSFLVGGNILGFAAALSCYIPLKWALQKYGSR